MFLGALVAGAEMAEALGDTATGEEFRSLFRKGRKNYDRLFNGEYYVQKVREVPRGQKLRDIFGNPVAPHRPKYQQGWGCLSDQLVGQWAAHVAGLGYLLPEDHVKESLRSIFKYNFHPDLSEHECCQRVYALGDEGGLLLCTWPRGKREKFPFPYSDEVWTGIEYQVAAHLMYEGMVDEGLAIVAAARERHDGVRRNPWNEFECGDHYARAMSSWSLLLALSGQRYDGRTGTLTFRPAISRTDFRCLYTASDAYGTVHQQFDKGRLSVRVASHHGTVELRALELTYPRSRCPKSLTCTVRSEGKSALATVAEEDGQLTITFKEKIELAPGKSLSVLLGPPSPRGG